MKQGLIDLWHQFKTYQQEEARKPKLLSGQDVMNTLGIDAGPMIGKILTELSEAQFNGEVLTAEEARQWIKTRYA
jgi:hypothetical protein